jgi:hypothetical protein
MLLLRNRAKLSSRWILVPTHSGNKRKLNYEVRRAYDVLLSVPDSIQLDILEKDLVLLMSVGILVESSEAQTRTANRQSVGKGRLKGQARRQVISHLCL